MLCMENGENRNFVSNFRVVVRVLTLAEVSVALSLVHDNYLLPSVQGTIRKAPLKKLF